MTPAFMSDGEPSPWGARAAAQAEAQRHALLRAATDDLHAAEARAAVLQRDVVTLRACVATLSRGAPWPSVAAYQPALRDEPRRPRACACGHDAGLHSVSHPGGPCMTCCCTLFRATPPAPPDHAPDPLVRPLAPHDTGDDPVGQ